MGKPTAAGAGLRRLSAIASRWLDRLCGAGADRLHRQFHRLDQTQAMEDSWHGATEAERDAEPPNSGAGLPAGAVALPPRSG